MRWLQRSLFLAAAVLLGYCGFIVAEGWIFQQRERAEFEKLAQAAVSGATLPAADRDGSIGRGSIVGGLIGRIEVPRLDVSVVVMEGSGGAVLRHAAGHIPGTALPGQPGNVGISAHRDTFFRPLRNIRVNDIVVFATLRGEFRYRVVSTSIVSPNDVSVLRPSTNEVLTLVTCYPFYFIGSAPDRFIVRAERVKS